MLCRYLGILFLAQLENISTLLPLEDCLRDILRVVLGVVAGCDCMSFCKFLSEKKTYNESRNPTLQAMQGAAVFRLPEQLCI